MMIVLIISVIILFFIVWILFVPFRFYIDTKVNQYFLKWSWLIKVSFIPDEVEFFFIRIKIPFYHMHIYPIKKLIEEEDDKEEEKKAGKSEKPKKKMFVLRRINKKEVRKIKLFSKLGWDVFKALRMRKLDVDIDTGDVIYNAWLIPVFVALNGNRTNLRVNYQGNVTIVLLFEHSVYRILIILIKFLYRNRKKLLKL